MSFIDAYMLKEKTFWRSVFIEFFGTTIFLFLVTAVCVSAPGTLAISCAIGLAISVLAHILGPLSGGHFNPAITFGTLVTSDSGIFKGCFYILAQLLGGEITFDLLLQ